MSSKLSITRTSGYFFRYFLGTYFLWTGYFQGPLVSAPRAIRSRVSHGTQGHNKATKPRRLGSVQWMYFLGPAIFRAREAFFFFEGAWRFSPSNFLGTGSLQGIMPLDAASQRQWVVKTQSTDLDYPLTRKTRAISFSAMLCKETTAPLHILHFDVLCC